MLIIQHPSVEAIDEEEGNRQRFSISPLEPGFGHTIGNSLRRVLLSSIPGAAVNRQCASSLAAIAFGAGLQGQMGGVGGDHLFRLGGKNPGQHDAPARRDSSGQQRSQYAERIGQDVCHHDVEGFL